MRNVIYAINVSLDGCCDHTKMTGNEDVHRYFTQMLRDADTLVYGRKTYELMVPFWPDVAKSNSAPTQAMNDFAQAFVGVRNMVVFSKTLDNVDDHNTKIVRGNLKDEVLRLKQEDGKNILLGGVDLPSQLIELDLVDEFHFVVQPIVSGEGRRLMDGMNLDEQLQLKLVETKPFGGGFVGLRYARK